MTRIRLLTDLTDDLRRGDVIDVADRVVAVWCANGRAERVDPETAVIERREDTAGRVGRWHGHPR